LERLRQWRDSGDRGMSVMLVHAPGGQGKTRLAAEFAARSHSHDLSVSYRWHDVQARQHLSTSTPANADVVPGEPTAGILVIVDYADRWPHSDLVRLLSDLRNDPHPVRVLMVGRSVRWYAALRGELSEHHVPTVDFALQYLAADRSAMFAAARDRYAALRRGCRDGELSADLDVNAAVELLFTTVLGLRVRERAGHDPARLASAIDFAIRALGPTPRRDASPDRYGG
jgi:hypothetical protein